MDIALNETARADLPTVSIPYVFHYIQYNDDGQTCTTSGIVPPAPGTRFEMTCDPNDPSFSNDVNIFQDVQAFQAQFDYIFGNLSEYNHVDPSIGIPYSGVVGDSRIVLVPKTTRTQPGAIHCSSLPGAYIWDSYADLTNSGLLGNGSELAIIIYGDFYTGNCTAGGSASLSGSTMSLYAHLVGSTPIGIKQNVGYTVLHELIHTAGLDHSFVNQSTVAGGCTQVDLGNPSTYYGSSGATSNNVMDYSWPEVYYSPQTSDLPDVSLSPCQWSTLYCEMANRYGTAICEKQDGVTQISDSESIGNFGSQIPVTINKNNEVLAGADLTLTGNIKFAPNVAITVRRGALLTIDNANLSACDSREEGRWEGIYVEGNYDLVQPEESVHPSPSESGVVKVYNSSVRDAYSVLHTYRFEPASDYHASWDRSYWGGVMYVRDSEFRNNMRVAEFMKYEKENRSLFRGVQFYGEQNASRPDRAITAWATHGIEVDDGCAFYDYSNESIYGINAFFEINNSIFRRNHESVVLEYTRSHSGFGFENRIGEEGGNEFSDNFGSISILTSDFQFRNNSVVRNNFIYNAKNYFVETYGRGELNIDDNSFSTSATNNAAVYLWTIQSSLQGSINCNVFSGAGYIHRGLSVSGNQSETSIEGNVFSGLDKGLAFKYARGVVFDPKTTQGNSAISHGNYWTGNEFDVNRDNTSTVRNHAEITFFSHDFNQGQLSNFNPDESSTYGGNERVVMAEAFFENDCTSELEVDDPNNPGSFPCEQFAGGGLSPDNPNQKLNLSVLRNMMDEAYSTLPVDGSVITDLVDCLSEEDKIRLYYLSLNYLHDESLYQLVRGSEVHSASDLSGLDRARQVWLFDNELLGEEPLLDYYDVACSDSKLAMPYLREHNFVIHGKVSSPDYLSCHEEGIPEDSPLEEVNNDSYVELNESCDESCNGVEYSIIDLIGGTEQILKAPNQIDQYELNVPYRYVKSSCPTHGTHLTKTIE